MSPFALSLIIFISAYAIIAIQRIPGIYIDRPTGALLGAAAMVFFRILPLQEAFRAIDMNTILFLLGMMILLGYVDLSGFFGILERFILKHAVSKRMLLAMVVFFSGILSALFMNDTICLLMAPIVLRLTRRLKINPVPYIIAIPTAANIGSAMTMIGNPQNALIGIRSGIPFLRFTHWLWPVSIIGLLLDFYLLDWMYAKDLRDGELPVVMPDEPLKLDKTLFAVSILCGAALLVFLCLGFPPAGVAMGLGSIAILAGAFKPRDVLKRIDWGLLVFFASLFIVMRGIEKAGVVQVLFEHLPRPGSAQNFAGLIGFCGTVVLLGNLVSNVPAVLLYVPLLNALPHAEPIWIALALSATLSGNLTIIGSAANVIVFESTDAVARVSFWEYSKIGVPITLFTMAVGIVLIYFRV